MVKLTSKVVSKGMFMQWEIFAQSRIAAKLKKFQFDRQLQPASWKVWVIARLSKSQWFDAQQEQMGKNVWNFSTINFAEKFFCISQRKSFSTKIVKKTFMCRSNATQCNERKTKILFTAIFWERKDRRRKRNFSTTSVVKNGCCWYSCCCCCFISSKSFSRFLLFFQRNRILNFSNGGISFLKFHISPGDDGQVWHPLNDQLFQCLAWNYTTL